MRILCVVGPQVRPAEMGTILSVLADHGLNPKPLSEAATATLSPEQVDELCKAMKAAPIPAYKPDQVYTLVELSSEHAGASRFLYDALSARIEGTARIPLWTAGVKRRRDIRNNRHPQALLREILITLAPDSAEETFVLSLFPNYQLAKAV